MTDVEQARWPVLLLPGPTAVGKSALAVAIAERLPAELVSVDSAAVYRGLDIGAAKPDVALRARHPHALLDLRDPAEPYTAADFRRDALAAIAGARERGRVPILVGGTMLYFKVLEEGLATLPASEPALRARLEARVREEGIAALHAELERIDPVAARGMDGHNAQRILRALEVFELTGRPISAHWQEQAVNAGRTQDALAHCELVREALVPADRTALHAAIDARLKAMFEAGFLDEVRALHARDDLHPELPAIRAVGYRQLWEHLDGAYDLAEARRRAAAATRQLARRQLTWLRRWTHYGRHEIASAASVPALADLLAERLSMQRARAAGGVVAATDRGSP